MGQNIYFIKIGNQYIYLLCVLGIYDQFSIKQMSIKWYIVFSFEPVSRLGSSEQSHVHWLPELHWVLIIKYDKLFFPPPKYMFKPPYQYRRELSHDIKYSVSTQLCRGKHNEVVHFKLYIHAPLHIFVHQRAEKH